MSGKKFCTDCGKELNVKAEICPACGVRQMYGGNNGKNRVTAGLFALLLGGLGAHKFYLGRTGMGVLYLLFFWTFIPAIVSLIEGIIYLTMDDHSFGLKYV